jgi:hypothetical protein
LTGGGAVISWVGVVATIGPQYPEWYVNAPVTAARTITIPAIHAAVLFRTYMG